MKLSLKKTPPATQQTACLVIGVFENGHLTTTGEDINKKTQDYIQKILSAGAFSGKTGQTLPLFYLGESGFERLLLVGCGKEETLLPTVFRKIASGAMKALNTSRATAAVSYLTELNVKDRSLAWKVKQITEAAYEGLYRFDQFKSEKEPLLALNQFIIHLPDEKEERDCEEALKQGLAIAKAVVLTKNLANMPSNICTPTFLAEEALALGKRYPSLSVNILEEKDMQALGMGALLAVSQGSAEEAKLICLKYQGSDPDEAPVALVGKGITFDTGGSSLKPADSMVGMKYDMCGAASVLGTLQAAAELNLAVNLVGVIAAVENMPGGKAYKPDDILTSMSGQTIEVISTDAEGRLILGDALTYCERFNPDVVIDIATLTGAVVIALGSHATGLLSNYQPLAEDLLKAGKESNDRAWQLPIWDEYQEQIKSPFADMANTGGRTAGTITAACFLSRFAKKFHWAHLDVAGTAASFVSGGTVDDKATGRPVPLLVQYLLNRVR